MKRFKNSLFGRFYGEGEAQGGNAGAAGGGTGSETPAEVVFTPEQQAKVNELLANNKRTLQAKLAETEKQVDLLKKSGTDTSVLQKKVKELQDSLLTKEELARQEAETLKTTFEQQLQMSSQAATQWKGRYETSVFSNELSKAAAKHDAFDPDQLAVLLERNSQVIESTDKDGKGTGEFKVLTKIQIDDKTLTLPIDEAVGKLRDSGKYPNQFKVKGSPGTGLTLNNSPHASEANPGEVPADMNSFMKNVWNKLPANVRR